MGQTYFRHKPSNTGFVLIDTGKCEACWICLDMCSHNVIGRINLPWHKHVRFVNKGACTGCLACVKSCKAGALIKSVK